MKQYLVLKVIQYLFRIISLLEFRSIKLFKCNIQPLLLGHYKSKIRDTMELVKGLYCCTCKHSDLRGQALIPNL